MSSGPVKLRTLEDGIPSEREPIPFLGAALPQVPAVRNGQVTTVGDLLQNSAQTGHTLVEDANYQILPTDLQVGMKPLTAPRTIWLPDVDTFPFQDLVIGDESLACSDALTITILPGPDTDDVIATTEGNVILSRPGEVVWLRRGGAANLWMVRR